MKTVKNLFVRLMKEEDGVTMIEYALLAALIAVAAIAGMKVLGPAINNKFSTVGNTVANP
jgi:pilus assembly protein Flp/PilA